MSLNVNVKGIRPTDERRLLLDAAAPVVGAARIKCGPRHKRAPEGVVPVWYAAYDLVRGTWVWVLVVAAMALVWVPIVNSSPTRVTEFAHRVLENTGMTTTIATTIAFLVALHQSASAARNSVGILRFADLTGSCTSIAFYAKALGVGIRGCNGAGTPSKLELVLRSIPYVVKYSHRSVGGGVRTEMLPLCANAELAREFADLRMASTDGDDNSGVDPLVSSLILIARQMHDLKSEVSRPIDVVFVQEIFKQIDAITDADGAIGGGSLYRPPRVLDFMMHVLFFIYFSLMIVSDMDNSTGWNTVWLVIVACVAIMGPYAVARLYENPYNVTTRSRGQAPYISNIAIETERSIVAIFRGSPGCRALR